jgi:hypothetical protein
MKLTESLVKFIKSIKITNTYENKTEEYVLYLLFFINFIGFVLIPINNIFLFSFVAICIFIFYYEYDNLFKKIQQHIINIIKP